MKKYYIKDGFGEKGPLTIDDIKLLKINKTTFIRQSDSENWVQADSVNEINNILTSNYKTLKIFWFTVLSFVLIGVVLFAISKLDLDSSYDTYNIIEEALPPPPTIDYQVTTHDKKFLNELFKGCNLTGEKKKLVNACNYTSSLVRNKSVNIAGHSPGTYNLGQACDIFDYCYNNWKYVNDPKAREVVEYASNTLKNGLNGDCDDFAVLICSMILSIGGEARINYAYSSNSAHAFTEVNLGRAEISQSEYYISMRYKKVYKNDGIWSRTDGSGNKWLNLDWFAKHPGGQYFDYNNGTTFYIIQQYCSDFTK